MQELKTDRGLPCNVCLLADKCLHKRPKAGYARAGKVNRWLKGTHEWLRPHFDGSPSIKPRKLGLSVLKACAISACWRLV